MICQKHGADVRRIAHNVLEFSVGGGMVRFFLVTGETGAALIDTGASDIPLAEFVREFTDLPVKLLLTHSDGDHTACANRFPEFFAHKNELEKLRANGVTSAVNYIADGEVFDLGGTTLEVIEIPGHTRGAVAYLLREQQILFAGDSVQTGPVFMFGEHRSLDDFIASTRKLLAYKSRIREIFPCHHRLPLGPEYIDYTLEDAESLRAGKLSPTEPGHPGLPCKQYNGRHVSFYF